MKLPVALNLNTALSVLGGLGVFAPDVASVATWLASMHVAWLSSVVRALGLLAAFCSAAPLVVPKLRAFLAMFGLATPPGAQAPWIPVTPVLVPVVAPSGTVAASADRSEDITGIAKPPKGVVIVAPKPVPSDPTKS